MTYQNITLHIKGVVVWLLTRCLLLYLVTAVVFYILVDFKKVSYKTLDYLKYIPAYLVAYAHGQDNFEMVEFLKAARYYENFIKVFPESIGAYSTLGFCYYHLGNKKKAVKNYEKAISLDEGLYPAYYNLGKIYIEEGRYEKALEVLQKGVNISSHRAINLPVLSPFLTAKEYQEEDTKQLRIITVGSFYAKSYELIALSYYALGKYPAMLTTTMRAINSFDYDRDRFYFLAGLALYKLERPEEAGMYLKETLLLNPQLEYAQKYLEILDKLEGKAANDKSFQHLAVEDFLKLDSPKRLKGLYYYIPVHRVNVQGRDTVIF